MLNENKYRTLKNFILINIKHIVFYFKMTQYALSEDQSEWKLSITVSEPNIYEYDISNYILNLPRPSSLYFAKLTSFVSISALLSHLYTKFSCCSMLAFLLTFAFLVSAAKSTLFLTHCMKSTNAWSSCFCISFIAVKLWYWL